MGTRFPDNECNATLVKGPQSCITGSEMRLKNGHVGFNYRTYCRSSDASIFVWWNLKIYRDTFRRICDSIALSIANLWVSVSRTISLMELYSVYYALPLCSSKQGLCHIRLGPSRQR
ncbi:hypothetical protein BDDG_00647 [Blastomyces dermatitidis ATCC 18188]|uniref:Uncharacterized protein n=1 Tax=Ajellomyces dermatitidis (strain ATCC 18188 / CBS 674.68) TaxID=653446 RepID=F2T451_AJEDA|nr:hypothetical protein BDDG_00647 [Blastomyces dermatitidis ATCC 18188]